MPKRCDAKAEWLAPNGFQACEKHRTAEDRRTRWLQGDTFDWETMPESGKCDYCLDGMHAASASKRSM